MPYHEIKIKETDYRYLENSANFLGISIQDMICKIIEKQRIEDKNYKKESPKNINFLHKKKGRWAELSKKIRNNPPLSGVGEYVRECSKEFREDFVFKHDMDK